MSNIDAINQASLGINAVSPVSPFIGQKQYTNSLSPNLAVTWSGFFNFLAVLVELILQVGSGAG